MHNSHIANNFYLESQFAVKDVKFCILLTSEFVYDQKSHQGPPERDYYKKSLIHYVTFCDFKVNILFQLIGAHHKFAFWLFSAQKALILKIMLVNRVHKPYFCKICKKTAGVKVCKCQKVFYCSRNCQKIDWTTHREDCCSKLLENHTSTTNQCASNSSCANNSLSLQENYFVGTTTVLQTHDDEHNTAAIREGRKQYDPTPLQYQQSDAIYSHSENCTAEPPTTTTTDNLALSECDFDENLFNLMSAVVDEGTEEEFLKSLNIRADELLSAYSLESDNNLVPSTTTTTSTQVLKQYMPVDEDNFVDDQLSEKLLEQNYRKRSYEFKPETQRLLKETKENLEKELSLFCESQQFADDMQLNSQNPKYVNHTTVQDNITMR